MNDICIYLIWVITTNFCSEWSIVGYGIDTFWDFWIRPMKWPIAADDISVLCRQNVGHFVILKYRNILLTIVF